MKTQSKNLFLLGLLIFLAIILTACPPEPEPDPDPDPAPVVTLPITMKSGKEIQKLLVGTNLKANNEATSFKASATPAPAGVTTETLSADDSETACVAWLDNSTKTIYYYAKGYTDAGKKIPLTSCVSLFEKCLTLTTIDVSGFDTSEVSSFSVTFSGCTALTTISGLDTLNTTNVTNFQGMFYNCSALTEIDISSFDASKVTNTGGMFQDCTELATIYAKVGTDWTTISSSLNMFNGCTNLKGGAGTTYDSGKIDVSYARIDGGTSAPGYFTEKQARAVAKVNARWAKACLVFLCGVYCTVGGSHARAQQKLSPRVDATGGIFLCAALDKKLSWDKI